MSRPEPGQRICPVCGGDRHQLHAHATDVEYFTTPETFAYRRCSGCGVLFIDPLPLARLQEIYPPSYYSYHEGSRGLVWRIKAALDARFYRQVLARIDAAQVDVLDVGGGTGVQIDAVRSVEPRFRSGHVVDLDPRGGEVARARGYRFSLCRFEDLPAGPAAHLILMLNLIEHVADPRAVLAAGAARLAPGGRIIVQTPNHDSWDARLFRHDGWGGYHCPRHWILFDEPAFRKLAEDCGLTVDRLDFTQGAPFWAVSIVNAMRRRGWVTVGRERPVFYHPLYRVCLPVFAAVDILRAPFARTSQMLAVLRRSD